MSAGYSVHIERLFTPLEKSWKKFITINNISYEEIYYRRIESKLIKNFSKKD